MTLHFRQWPPKGYYTLEVYDSIDVNVEDSICILQYYKIAQASVLHKDLFGGLVLIGSNAW